MRPIAEYKICEYSPVSALLRTAADQQTDNGLLWVPSNQTNPRGGVGIGGWEIHNRSSATVNCGLAIRIANSAWVAGQYTHSGTTFTDDTAAAQNTTTNDFELETLVNNDGFIVACKYPFNALSLDVTTAGATGAPAVDMAYSSTSSGASTWTTLTTTNAFVAPLATWTAVSTPVIWVPPSDWTPVIKGAAPFDAIPAGYYAIRIRKTTAQTGTAALARAIEVFRIYDLTEGLTDNSTLTKNYFPAELYQYDVSGVAGYISSVTNLQSRVTAFIRER